jgi:hypothetical protein
VIRIPRSNVADLERQHCPEKDTLQIGRSVDLKEIADPFESHHGNFTRKASGAQILERLAPIWRSASLQSLVGLTWSARFSSHCNQKKPGRKQPPGSFVTWTLTNINPYGVGPQGIIDQLNAIASTTEPSGARRCVTLARVADFKISRL